MIKVILIAAAAYTIFVLAYQYARRKRSARFFGSLGFEPLDINAAPIGGAIAVLFTPGRGLFVRNSFRGLIADREAYFLNYSSGSGRMKAAIFIRSTGTVNSATPARTLGPNLLVTHAGPWTVFLSERAVSWQQMASWFALVVENSKALQ